MQPAATRSLAEFIAASRWEDIPPAVRREGMRTLVNFIGCALGGAQDEAMSLAVRVLAPFFGPAQAIVVGRLGEVAATLLDDPLLLGGPISDERYLLVSAG